MPGTEKFMADLLAIIASSEQSEDQQIDAATKLAAAYAADLKDSPEQWTGKPAILKEAVVKPTVAVLPFTNMSGDPEQEFFADGLTEDILTELSRRHELFVISRHRGRAEPGAWSLEPGARRSSFSVRRVLASTREAQDFETPSLRPASSSVRS